MFSDSVCFENLKEFVVDFHESVEIRMLIIVYGVWKAQVRARDHGPLSTPAVGA